MIGFSRFEQSRANRWRPGQSGNPSGHSGEYGQAVRLARQAAVYAVQRLIELMESDDERVVAVACNSILDRAFGKPGLAKEEKDDLETRIASMSQEERLARMRELLAPMHQHLHEPDDEQVDAEVTPIESGDRHPRRRSSAA
jgi:hypothetical protein